MRARCKFWGRLLGRKSRSAKVGVCIEQIFQDGVEILSGVDPPPQPHPKLGKSLHRNIFFSNRSSSRIRTYKSFVWMNSNTARIAYIKMPCGCGVWISLPITFYQRQDRVHVNCLHMSILVCITARQKMAPATEKAAELHESSGCVPLIPGESAASLEWQANVATKDVFYTARKKDGLWFFIVSPLPEYKSQLWCRWLRRLPVHIRACEGSVNLSWDRRRPPATPLRSSSRNR